MQHISISEGQDLVPLRCPCCGQLLCERVGKLKAERVLNCSLCHNAAAIEALVLTNPALGRVLTAQSDIDLIRRGV